MARGRVTLYEVAPEVRAKGAAEARRSAIQMLSNPNLTQEQKTELRERLKWVSKVETCNIADVLAKPEPPAAEAPAASDRQPVNHNIDVVESVSVTES